MLSEADKKSAVVNHLVPRTLHNHVLRIIAKIDRPRRDIDLQMRIRCDHCAARAMRITRDRCSSSTPDSARMTTSPTTISMQAAAPLRSGASSTTTAAKVEAAPALWQR